MAVPRGGAGGRMALLYSNKVAQKCGLIEQPAYMCTHFHAYQSIPEASWITDVPKFYNMH